MPNPHKQRLLGELQHTFGTLSKLANSQSLYTIGNDAARIYIRYSKLHKHNKTFFGLRSSDLRELEGHNGFICFLLDDTSPPVVLPYAEFEDVFNRSEPAADGQYKVQLTSRGGNRELYIARQGRFNVEGFVGLDTIARAVDHDLLRSCPDLSHSGVQTLLSGIGVKKGYDVFVPGYDAKTLDWNLIGGPVNLRSALPARYSRISAVLGEVDVLWIARGRDTIESLFEVEHATPVYSGLLRFNDVLLTDRTIERFNIVSNESRHSLFLRQIDRPTFRASGLSDLATFLKYVNVWDWWNRLVTEEASNER